jgi:hypothetical protein
MISQPFADGEVSWAAPSCAWRELTHNRSTGRDYEQPVRDGFTAWAFYNADLLRSGRISEADLENIAEEIESLGRSQAHELESRISQIMERLLKLKLDSTVLLERNQRAWRVSIARQRAEIAKVLRDSPSLRRKLRSEMLSRWYADARKVFMIGFDIEAPPECPFTWEDVLADVAVAE